jgi:site-specific recombinase XerD
VDVPVKRSFSSPGKESKINRLLHNVLTEEATALVVYYVEKVKPLLEKEPTPFLFPNKSASGKRSDTLSKQLSKLVKKRLGIDFNPHLDRHLVAKLIVDEAPGNYEAPRRLLGHKNSETTNSAYEGLCKERIQREGWPLAATYGDRAQSGASASTG